MSIASDIHKLNPGAIVALYEIDATALGGDLFRFHPGVNELGNDVVWQGNTYLRFPIMAEGFERTSSGSSPRPKLTISNIGGVLGAEIRGVNDFVGAKVKRTRTFVRYLDAVNFAAGNALADPNAHFPPETYYVDRKSSENKLAIEWELASPLDLPDVKLPRRQVIANVCTWLYRGAECGYSGGAVATAADVPTADINQDACGKRVSSCQLRFGTGVLRFGGFPSAGLTR